MHYVSILSALEKKRLRRREPLDAASSCRCLAASSAACAVEEIHCRAEAPVAATYGALVCSSCVTCSSVPSAGLCIVGGGTGGPGAGGVGNAYGYAPRRGLGAGGGGFSCTGSCTGSCTDSGAGSSRGGGAARGGGSWARIWVSRATYGGGSPFTRFAAEDIHHDAQRGAGNRDEPRTGSVQKVVNVALVLGKERRHVARKEQRGAACLRQRKPEDKCKLDVGIERDPALGRTRTISTTIRPTPRRRALLQSHTSTSQVSRARRAPSASLAPVPAFLCRSARAICMRSASTRSATLQSRPCTWRT